jgi:hypothetical protein
LVAKRFVKLINNDETDQDPTSRSVSLEENRIEVEAELIRVTQGKWFMENFYKFCRNKPDVAVDQSALKQFQYILITDHARHYVDVAFTDAFLAQEIGSFSAASGIKESFDIDAEGITWLIENKRPTTIIKFSGTLMHRTRQKDLRSLTVQAFAHFVFGHSKQALVFADLQGASSVRVS